MFISFIEAAKDWATNKGIQMKVTRPFGILILSFQTEEELGLLCAELKQASLDALKLSDVPAITHFDSALFAKGGQSWLIRGHYYRKMEQVLNELPRICARPCDMVRRRKIT